MKRLLLIEDSKVDAMEAQAAIELNAPGEFQFTICRSIKDALKKLQSETFDLISLDLNLPDAERLTGLAQLKEFVKSTPLVVMTGENEPALGLEAITLGAQDFVVKGASSYGKLLARVFNHAIERKKMTALSMQTLELEHKVLNEALKQSQLLVVRLDRDLKIVFASDTCQNKFGLDANGFSEKHISDVLPGLELEQVREAIENRKQLEIKELRLSGITKAVHEDIWVDVFFWPYNHVDRDNDEYMLLLVDVSDRLNAKLQRDEFLAALAHDVKNPLVGEQQVLTGILSGAKDALPPIYYDSLLSLRRSNQALLLMLSNLIDVYNIEANERQFVFENVNLLRVIDEVLLNFKFLLKSADIKVVKKEFPESFVAKLDVTAFVRIFSNLLHNACKFAKKGSEVNLYLVSDANEFQFGVESFGAPIKDDEKNILFKRFKRSLLGQEYLHSSGLGLYLCKRLAEGHNGSIECVNKGETTRLVVTFPLTAGDT
ncbi:MAG: response regulator [Cyanobacteria bacterium TGS_CYA1]|nr:response regulator [Cyanobacteria bacterium TGS_CYA1]